MFKKWSNLPKWVKAVAILIPIIYVIAVLAFGYGRDYESQVLAYPKDPVVISFKTFMGLIDDKALSGNLEIYANHKVFYDGLVTHSMGKGVKPVTSKKVYLIKSFINSVNHNDIKRITDYHKVKVLGSVNTVIINPVPGRSGAVMQGAITTVSSVAIVIFYAFIIYLMTRQGGLMRMIDRFHIVHGNTGVTLNDVAGMESVKVEVREVVDYLKDRKAFSDVGAKAPKGILLYGPPGNGKTLIAKAIAGECNVPFIEQNGGNMMGKFLGESADGIKRLFKIARQSAIKHGGCIIFIDEIDAIGSSRWGTNTIAHSENHSALDTLLAEMDGFYGNNGIVVIAATNRLEVLDPALVRPGRFDRKIMVSMPGKLDREKILATYVAKVPHDDLDLTILASMSPGFSGADISNWVNEAAIQTARRKSSKVTMEDFTSARDIIIAGPHNTGVSMSDVELSAVAWHEAGHAEVRHATGGYVDRVSIMPRGQALGITFSTPEDSVLHTQEQIKNELKVLLAGRAAEELFVGYISSGAANDLERASSIAFNAVATLGLGDRGLYVPQTELGRHDAETSAAHLIDTCYADAKTILERHAGRVSRLHEDLMELKDVNYQDYLKS